MTAPYSTKYGIDNNEVDDGSRVTFQVAEYRQGEVDSFN